ncbi:hypothetical protein CKK34_5982 [Yarrowia sp. E02]|nr:hypothetical protein CKK34_5982 [Yarrowia sp. E02]
MDMEGSERLGEETVDKVDKAVDETVLKSLEKPLDEPSRNPFRQSLPADLPSPQASLPSPPAESLNADANIFAAESHAKSTTAVGPPSQAMQGEATQPISDSVEPIQEPIQVIPATATTSVSHVTAPVEPEKMHYLDVEGGPSNAASDVDFTSSIRNSIHSLASFQPNPANRASYVDLGLPEASSSDNALAALTVRSPVRSPVLKAASPPPQNIIPAPLTFNPPKDNITFQVKVIKWRTPANYLVKTPIILQDENGPCPFIALVNTLVFTEAMSPIPPGPGRPISALLENKEMVSKNLLLDHLGQWLLGIGSRQNGPHVNPDDLNTCLRLLPELYSGLNINPRFDGTFEEGPELALFRAFEVDVVHGWIADPKESYHDDVMEVGSYDAAQLLQIEATEEGKMKKKEREALHRQLAATFDFMDDNPSQLTTYGIRYIEEILVPGSVCVFFRNNHFATLYKQPTSGRLFSLVTDRELCGRNGIVWISLEGTSGTDDTFYTGGFDLVQMMTEQEQEESRRRAHQTVEATNDFHLAKQIQEQDDAEYARQIQEQDQQQRRRPQNATATTGTTARRQQQTRSGKATKSKPDKTKGKKSKDSKDKKCVVM